MNELTEWQGPKENEKKNVDPKSNLLPPQDQAFASCFPSGGDRKIYNKYTLANFKQCLIEEDYIYSITPSVAVTILVTNDIKRW